ncbi:MAG: molybdopterin-dependent oxidoreductase, partial [Nitrososphaera sp.]|nr:molybdopterin-dependent oxidoreductase [Nitrososphaera sp.]
MNNNELLELGFDAAAPLQLNRRKFLQITGSGLVLLFTVGETTPLLAEPQGGNLPTDFNAFLKIGEDGRVACYTGKIEMGQGVNTSLGQMLAEELDISIDNVDMVMGNTDLCPWDRGTWGSQTTRQFGPALRQAGAEARMVLLEMAADRLNVPVNALAVKDGVVYVQSNKQNNVSYAELTKGKRIERRVTGTAKVKSPSEFNIIGKSFKRRDGMEKVTGKA